jgi:hypothetical protein
MQAQSPSSYLHVCLSMLRATQLQHVAFTTQAASHFKRHTAPQAFLLHGLHVACAASTLDKHCCCGPLVSQTCRSLIMASLQHEHMVCVLLLLQVMLCWTLS